MAHGVLIMVELGLGSVTQKGEDEGCGRTMVWVWCRYGDGDNGRASCKRRKGCHISAGVAAVNAAKNETKMKIKVLMDGASY